MFESELRPESDEPVDLAREAEALRQQILEARHRQIENTYPLGRKILYLSTVLVVLGCSFVILGVSSVRRTLVESLAVRIAGNPDASAQVFPLPAPPPKPARVDVNAPAYSAAATALADALYADSSASAGETQPQGPGGEERKFVPPPKSAEASQAYALLQSKNEIAAAVIAGRREGFTFKEWLPRKADPPEFWIDVVAERASDGKEVHLIWQVNTESGAIQPLSQEARDLER